MSYDEMLDRALYVVEASTAEYSLLYAKHATNAYQNTAYAPEQLQARFDEELQGWGVTVGTVQVKGKDAPVVISLQITNINGHPVLFWHATSQAVYHPMIEAWFAERCPAWKQGRHCYAENFNQAMSYLNRIPRTVGHVDNMPCTWHFTYFHGKLEEEMREAGHMPPDIAGAHIPLEQAIPAAGRYDLMVGERRPAVGFFIPGMHGALRGIIVADNDSESIAYGERLLRERPTIL